MGTWTMVVLIVAALLQAATAATVNLLFVNEKNNTVASAAIDAAVKYMADQNLGIQVNKYTAENKDTKYLRVIDICEQVQSAVEAGQPPHLVVDTTLSGTSSEIAKSVSKALAIPTVSGSYGDVGDISQWSDLTADEKKYLVQVLPPGDSIIRVIRKYIQHQNISSAGIIFDNSFVMDQKYTSLLKNVPCRYIIRHMHSNDASAARDAIMHFKEADLVNFFVVGTPNTVKTVLEAGNLLKMYGRKYGWFVVSKDTDPVQCACSNSTLLHIVPHPSDTTQQRLEAIKVNQGLTESPHIDAGFYFDLALKAIQAVSQMADSGVYGSNYSVLTCEARQDGERTPRSNLDLMSALQQVSTPDTYGPMMLTSNGASHMEFSMKLYRTQIVSSRVVARDDVGTYEVGSPAGNFTKLNQQAIDSFKAVTFYRIVTLEHPPFVMKKGLDAKGKMQFSGYCIDMLEDIQKILNFEYEIYEVEDGRYGELSDDNVWNGIIRDMLDKKADIAVAALWMMAEREIVVDFTLPYYDVVGITILMKKPMVPTSLFRFLTVLETDVWVTILGAYFVTSILLLVFDRFSPYSYKNNKQKYIDDEEKREFSVSESFWFTLTSLTPQGGGEAPKNLSGRLVAAAWWLFGFIIIASYTANLAAFLTVSRLATPIESLEELSQQYKIQYAPMKGTSVANYFERMAHIEDKYYDAWKNMTLQSSSPYVERAKLAVWDYPVDDRYTKIWKAMQEAGLPNSLEEAKQRVLQSPSSDEGFAFLGEKTQIDYLTMTSCDFISVGKQFSRRPYTLAVQKGSPLKDQLSGALMKLLNGRNLEGLQVKWWNQNPDRKACEQDNQSEGISLQNIGGVFIVISVGFVIACVTILGDFWYSRYWKPNRTVASPSSNTKLTPEHHEQDIPSTDLNTKDSQTGSA